jgi:hypothetical protein
MLGKVPLLLQMTMGGQCGFFLQLLYTCHLTGASTLNNLEKLPWGREDQGLQLESKKLSSTKLSGS